MTRSGRLRAKDADRERVLDTIIDARESGQLSFEEYEQRTRAAAAAVTLGELSALTADLQDVPDAPKPAGLEQFVITAQPSAREVATQQDHRVPWSRVGKGMLGLGVVFGIAAGIIVGIGAMTGSSSIVGAKPRLHEAAGFDALVADIDAEFGSTEVAEVVLYPEYAVVRIPAEDDPTHLEGYYYDGDFDDPNAAGVRATDEPLVDLATIDGSVVEQLIDQAPSPLNVDDPDSTYAIIETWGDPVQPAVAVYASNDYESGYLVAAVDGHLLDAYPYVAP